MPIEIKEINVKIRIEEGKPKNRPSEARPAAGLTEKERRQIVRQCVEETLRQLRRRG